MSRKLFAPGEEGVPVDWHFAFVGYDDEAFPKVVTGKGDLMVCLGCASYRVPEFFVVGEGARVV
ncbi:MAG: hypothetical protein ACRECH_15385 [Nitrososphaerales archaeon]